MGKLAYTQIQVRATNTPSPTWVEAQSSWIWKRYAALEPGTPNWDCVFYAMLAALVCVRAVL